MKSPLRSHKKIPLKKKKKKSVCEWCHNNYLKEHNSQKYCSDDCKEYARMEATNNRVRKYRKKYDKNYSDWIGCGSLGEHRSSNDDVEMDLIRKEFSRLRLRR